MSDNSGTQARVFYEYLKQIAVGAVDASNPTKLMFGIVQSTSPLTILVEQKLLLTEKQLVLSTLVQDFDVDMIVDHQTESTSGGSGDDSFASHQHAYKGQKTFKVLLGLKNGEKVALIRMQGGQQFFVLDRLR